MRIVVSARATTHETIRSVRFRRPDRRGSPATARTERDGRAIREANALHALKSRSSWRRPPKGRRGWIAKLSSQALSVCQDWPPADQMQPTSRQERNETAGGFGRAPCSCNPCRLLVLWLAFRGRLETLLMRGPRRERHLLIDLQQRPGKRALHLAHRAAARGTPVEISQSCAAARCAWDLEWAVGAATWPLLPNCCCCHHERVLPCCFHCPELPWRCPRVQASAGARPGSLSNPSG